MGTCRIPDVHANESIRTCGVRHQGRATTHEGVARRERVGDDRDEIHLLGREVTQDVVQNAAVAVVLGLGGSVDAQSNLELHDVTRGARGAHVHR